MKHSRSLILVVLLAFVFLIFYTSCQKEANSSANIPQGQQRISIRLSDNPVNFDAVNVDIQSVAVQVIPDSCQGHHHDDDDNDGDDDRDHDHDARCSVWDTLDIHPGVYNLLDLANGADTILANGFTVSGKISKIRLTLGDQNSVVIDGVSYPLTLWNNDPHITIKVKGEDVDMISQNDLQFWLDFDAGRSIVHVRDNNFVLKPFLRVWLPAHTASVSGHVQPDSAASVVAAIFNGDTLVAIPKHDDGFFKIRGITATSADVFINATANGYQDTTIAGVQLSVGKDTDVGTVQLHQ
jgi:Domain of unknown function (DUF4382)